MAEDYITKEGERIHISETRFYLKRGTGHGTRYYPTAEDFPRDLLQYGKWIVTCEPGIVSWHRLPEVELSDLVLTLQGHRDEIARAILKRMEVGHYSVDDLTEAAIGVFKGKGDNDEDGKGYSRN